MRLCHHSYSLSELCTLVGTVAVCRKLCCSSLSLYTGAKLLSHGIESLRDLTRVDFADDCPHVTAATCAA